MMYEDVIRDFAERTRKNLRAIERLKAGDQDVNETRGSPMRRQKITLRGNRCEKSSLPSFLFYPKQLWDLIRKSVGAWVDDYAPSMGAALAYYTLFSIAPLLIIAIAMAGLVFGQEAARGEVVAQIQGLIGREGAIVVQGLLKSANDPARNIFATMVSTITLLIGATTVFAELQSDLDRIWRVPAPEKANGMWTLLRTH